MLGTLRLRDAAFIAKPSSFVRSPPAFERRSASRRLTQRPIAKSLPTTRPSGLEASLCRCGPRAGHCVARNGSCADARGHDVEIEDFATGSSSLDRTRAPRQSAPLQQKSRVERHAGCCSKTPTCRMRPSIPCCARKRVRRCARYERRAARLYEGGHSGASMREHDALAESRVTRRQRDAERRRIGVATEQGSEARGQRRHRRVRSDVQPDFCRGRTPVREGMLADDLDLRGGSSMRVPDRQ